LADVHTTFQNFTEKNFSHRNIHHPPFTPPTLSTMPTLRLIYLTDQYAGVTTEDATNNTRTAEVHEQSRFPIDDATRNASSNTNNPPAVGGEKMEEQSDDHEEGDDYIDTLLKEAIDKINSRSFGSNAVRHQQVQVPHEEIVLSSDEEDSENESSLEFVDTAQQFQHEEMISSDEESDNDSTTSVHLDAIQQFQHEEMISSDEESDNDSTTKSVHLDAIQQFQHEEMISSDEESDNESTTKSGHLDAIQQFQHEEMASSDEESDNDSTTSVHVDATHQKSGNKRKRTSQQSFEKRFNDLMAFKAKYGHCNVSCIGEDASLGRWCSVVRRSYKKIQKNEKPLMNLSNEEIQRLNDAGFSLCLRKKECAAMKTFEERFNNLMAFKAMNGHCNVSFIGEDASLGRWCSVVRRSYKKIQKNEKPLMNLSDEQIQRFNDAGFKFCLRKRELQSIILFGKRFNDLMAFKAKFGHCNVSLHYGENVTLGKWCAAVRGAYKKMQNNQKTYIKLSDEQIQRLNDAGFKWCLQKKVRVGSVFDKRFNDLMAFKAKFGHCNVSQYDGEDVTLGRWCGAVRGAYKKMQNNQKTYIKLSDEQIQRLNDVGFKWCRYSKSFDEHFNELMAFKAKYGHCNVSQYGEDASLGKWCCRQRGSYKKMEHNRIQRLNDAGFNWIW
jgi:hypothetical protein